MKVLFIPVLRTAANYSVSFGRRWSVLEQMLLVELAGKPRSVAELTALANLPGRLVIEALINLLRINWIEIRASEEVVRFQATGLGTKLSKVKSLPATSVVGDRWISLCFERVTGSWLRAEDLTLVHENDLPKGASSLNPSFNTYTASDGDLRALLYLSPQESLEPDEPRLKTPSRHYARVGYEFGTIEGLPEYAGQALRQEIADAVGHPAAVVTAAKDGQPEKAKVKIRATITANDLFGGGPDQLRVVQEALSCADTTVVIHSCFIHPKTIETLLPDLGQAAKRRVRVDLLWGLHRDPEESSMPPPVRDAETVLNRLPPAERKYVQLSPVSSGSHGKVILYDDVKTKSWVSVVGSCNFLSTWFDAIDVAVRVRSPTLAYRLAAWLTTAQQPASGSWSAIASRLNRVSGLARIASLANSETGDHEITLVVDGEHYAAVRTARDKAKRDIVVACDLFGLAAETSVLVPMEEAAKGGVPVSLLYQRPSRILTEQERQPDREALQKRGLSLEAVEELHAKILAWDDEDVVVSSFNWLSTSVDGARARGAEFGLAISGPEIRGLIASRFSGNRLGQLLSRGDGVRMNDPAKTLDIQPAPASFR